MKMNEKLNVIYWWGGVHTSFIGLYKQNHVDRKKNNLCQISVGIVSNWLVQPPHPMIITYI